MYVSKYYTCEEIDQRLLQGYYDDFVKAGFAGTLLEFHKFVLSIKDKVDQGDYEQAMKDLEDKVDQKIADLNADEVHQKLKEELEKELEEVKKGIPTLVSQLENDADYQTREQVEKFISDLVDGADKSMDTLRELADALNNDPNFAANVINLITQLRTDLEKEIERAKEAEKRLTDDLNSEVTKREEGDKAILQLIDGFNQRLLDLQTNIGNFQQEFTDRLNEQEKAIHAVEDKLAEEVTRVEGLIESEAQARKEGDREIKDQLTDLKQEVNEKIGEATQATRDLETQIQLEAQTRQSEDAKLEAAIQEEATKRLSDKAELASKLSEEVNNRINGDTILKEKLEVETKAREADITSVTSKIESEAVTRENADKILQSNIDNLKDSVDSKVENLADKLAQETARAKEAENNKVDKKEGYGLSKNDLTDELFEKLVNLDQYANYITKVSELVNDLGFQTKEDVKAEIEKVIDSAPDALNTLKELADALDNDPNFAATITNRLTQLATQLNKEVQDRKDADEAIKEAYTLAIQGAVNNLQAALTVLEGTVNNNYKELSKDIDLLDQEDKRLDSKIDSTKEDLLDKIAELRTNVTEQINSLNLKWVEFKTSVEGQISDQNGKISANTAAIQTNLELIQALQKQYAEIPNDMQALINTEAELRKAADDALRTQIDLINQKIIENRSHCDSEIGRLETQMANDKLEFNNNLDKVKEELEDLVKNSSNTVGSESIKVTKQPGESGSTETKVEAIINPDDPLLSVGPQGIQSELSVDKQETEEQVTYTVKGKGGEVIEVIEVPKRMGEDFTEEDAENLFNSIYGEAFNPDAPGALTGMTPEEAEAIYKEVYNQ